MRSPLFRFGLWSIALALAAASLPLRAQQQPTQPVPSTPPPPAQSQPAQNQPVDQPASHAPSTEAFRWVDFHSPADNDIVIWVTRALQVSDWTAIREIGVQWDSALVITVKRPTPQSSPVADTFNIWSVSLTNQSSVTQLLTGVNLRLFDWQRFADGTPPALPALYDNCRECAANTYFTAFYYDVRNHSWAARWMRGTQSIPVWNANPPSSTADWTQLYAVMGEGDGHVELATWNHFDYGKQKPPEDFVYRYDLDPFSSLERSVLLTGKAADAMELRLCRGQNAVEGLARGQDSVLCQQMFPTQVQRKPVTTPPADNRGQSTPPKARH